MVLPLHPDEIDIIKEVRRKRFNDCFNMDASANTRWLVGSVSTPNRINVLTLLEIDDALDCITYKNGYLAILSLITCYK